MPQHPLFNGIPIGHVFLAFPGVLLAHTLVLPFPRPLGERALSPFLGFSLAPSVGLKCVLVGLRCQAVLVKNFRVRSIRLFISSFLTVSFTWGSCGELGASSPREPLGLFTHQSDPLFLPYERLSSRFFFLMFYSRAMFSNVLPPYSSTLYLPQ